MVLLYAVMIAVVSLLVRGQTGTVRDQLDSQKVVSGNTMGYASYASQLATYVASYSC